MGALAGGLRTVGARGGAQAAVADWLWGSCGSLV